MGEFDDTASHADVPPHPGPAGGLELWFTPLRRGLLLRLFAGATPHEIARTLGRSPSTVSNTIATIRKRLGVRRDVDALREALRRRIVTLDEIEQCRHELQRDGIIHDEDVITSDE